MSMPWHLYEPRDMRVPARVARMFYDATGELCYEWKYFGQYDRGGWSTRQSWRDWVRYRQPTVSYLGNLPTAVEVKFNIEEQV